MPREDGAKHCRKDGHARAVVEEALAVEDCFEAARCPDLAEKLNDGDRIAIVSTSGQIGFLQQLTDHQSVLREAISRLNYKQNPEAYAGSTRISEYVASQSKTPAIADCSLT